MEDALVVTWQLVKIGTYSLIFALMVCCGSIVLQATVYEWRKRRTKEAALAIPIHYTAKMLAVKEWIDELNRYTPEKRPCHELSPFEDMVLLEEIAWLKSLDSLLDYEWDFTSIRSQVAKRIELLQNRRLNLVDPSIQV